MNIGKKGAVGSVAVAVDKDKGSQYALRWAVDNLLAKGQTLFIVHVKINHQTNSNPRITEDTKELSDEQIKELFLPFRCYCTRKDIQCKDVILEDNDVAKAITEYAAQFAIENLVVGASAKGSFLRFKSQDLSLSISKAAPEFCNVYIISKGKVSSLRPAIKNVPAARQASNVQPNYRSEPNILSSYRSESAENSLSYSKVENDSMPATRSSFARVGRFPVMARDSEMTMHDVDSSMGNNRRSTDRLFPSSMGDQFDTGRNGRLSNGSSIDADSMCSGRQSFQSPLQYPHKSVDFYSNDIEFSSSSLTHNNSSWSSCSQTQDDLEAEMRRLKLELKQTMDMYSNACKEALSEKQKAMELHRWKIEEQQRLEEAKLAEEAALALVEKEKSKCRAALEAAETAQRIAELESQKRKHAEMKALKESEEKKKALDSLTGTDIRCRRYSIEEIETATEFFSQARKIGEGGYGPVYKCYLDHTEVAVKVLRPDAAQGRMQFQQEVEILSCIRHPNMVLLLGACPEYGCLVYDYMHNGSLEDRLLRRGNTPPLSWQLRFRIAAEIGTGLLFLHQTKPEPLVHRDLKPANILLDRNFVSKISDVGLARLVPPSVANDVTQYRMTSTAGTFCYIDPEYQQTGMLGVKSDVYSLGIMLLQIITAKPAMGLTHHVERAIDKGTFAEMLDPSVPDWPLDAALAFAKMALRCAELRRKDRPDLSTVVLPELNRLRALAEENMVHYNLVASANCSPHPSLPMMPNQEVISSYTLSSAFTNDESLKSHSSSSSLSMFGRRAY